MSLDGGCVASFRVRICYPYVCLHGSQDEEGLRHRGTEFVPVVCYRSVPLLLSFVVGLPPPKIGAIVVIASWADIVRVEARLVGILQTAII